MIKTNIQISKDISDLRKELTPSSKEAIAEVQRIKNIPSPQRGSFYQHQLDAAYVMLGLALNRESNEE